MGCIKCSGPHSNISPSFPSLPLRIQDFGPPTPLKPNPPNEKSPLLSLPPKTSDNHPVHNICVSLGEIPPSHPHPRYLRHIFVCTHTPSPQPPKPVTSVTTHHQTHPTAVKNYGFPKTDALVTRVKAPFHFAPPFMSAEGVSMPSSEGFRPTGTCSFTVYCADPLLLFRLFFRNRLKFPAGSQPFRPAGTHGGERTYVPRNRACADKPLDNPTPTLIIARPRAHTRA